ncbi:hypothetical protein [Membranihabitans maritimus]|uniref:hypothetical protein n=1 Tax=Membranihabitans maritimus TaxID=2904244 RepID=UPI001F451A37|nr:hypothetical protein [Membranihabitans maritimus]
MGILKDIKKMVFGAKSVGRSARGKLNTETDEFVENVKNRTKDFMRDAKENIDDLGSMAEKKVDELKEKYHSWKSEAREKSDELKSEIDNRYNSASSHADERLERLRRRADEFRAELNESEGEKSHEEIQDTIDSLKTESESIKEDLKNEAESIRNKAENLHQKATEKINNESTRSGMDKLKDSTEAIGNTILAKAAEFIEGAKYHAEDIGGKLEKKSDQVYQRAQKYIFEKDESGLSLADKAQAAIDDLKTKWKKTVDKAQQAAKEYEENKGKTYRPSEQDKANLEDSLMDNKDEFWRKAESYADGEYDRVKDVEITKKESGSSKKDSPPAPGFVDADGDGNEIVDDAILLDEEE